MLIANTQTFRSRSSVKSLESLNSASHLKVVAHYHSLLLYHYVIFSRHQRCIIFPLQLCNSCHVGGRDYFHPSHPQTPPVVSNSQRHSQVSQLWIALEQLFLFPETGQVCRVYSRATGTVIETTTAINCNGPAFLQVSPVNAQGNICKPRLWELQDSELSNPQQEEMEDLQALSWGF